MYNFSEKELITLLAEAIYEGQHSKPGRENIIIEDLLKKYQTHACDAYPRDMELPPKQHQGLMSSYSDKEWQNYELPKNDIEKFIKGEYEKG